METIHVILIFTVITGAIGLSLWMGYKYGVNKQADRQFGLFEEMNDQMLHLESANAGLQEKIVKLTPKPKRKYTKRKK